MFRAGLCSAQDACSRCAVYLLRAFQSFYHVDLFIFSRDHHADQHRYAEREQDTCKISRGTKGQLHFIFQGERFEQVVRCAYAERQADNEAKKRHLKVLTGQKLADPLIFKSDDFQRCHFAIALGVAHHAEVIKHHHAENHGT